MAKGKKGIITIVINDEFFVERDSIAYILYQKTKDKIDCKGNYGNLESCLRKAYVLIAESRLDERTTVLDYVRELKATTNELNETLKKGLNG